MVRILSDGDVAQLLAVDDLLGVVEEAFVKQGRGEGERPDRPHYPVGTGLDGDEPLGMGLTMPAYVHGQETFATKLVGVHEGNAERGLPTVNAQVVVTDARTGQPLAFMHGNRITNARTGCIGGLAVRELARAPVDLGVFGAGTQARWQTRAVAAATDLERVRVYSPSDSRRECASDLRAELDVDARAVDAPEAVLDGADAIVAATTSATPVFPGSALEPGQLVVGVGSFNAEMQELDAETFARAARVFADVPEEVAGIGDLLATDLRASDLIPLSEVFEGRAGREADDEILVVDSVGTAVLDAATAEYLHGRATGADAGTTVEF